MNGNDDKTGDDENNNDKCKRLVSHSYIKCKYVLFSV